MGDLVADLTALQSKLKNKSALTAAIGERALLPYFAQRMTDTGIHDRTGAMRSAVTKRGASGNVFDASNEGVTVGVDYAGVPHAEFVLRGSVAHPINARRVSNLKFWWAKRGVQFVGPSVNHPGQPAKLVYYADGSLDSKVEEVIAQELRP